MYTGHPAAGPLCALLSAGAIARRQGRPAPLAGCQSSVASTAPTTSPAGAARDERTAPPPIRGTATGIQTGVGDLDAPALEVSVSFANDGGDRCEVTAYALAWDRSAKAVRQACSARVTLAAGGTVAATCLVPFSSPMRKAQPSYANAMEVVDVVATCHASL